MRRAAIAIPSNIAEGHRRRSKKDFRQFLIMANSSAAELETQIEISKQLPKTKNLDYIKIDELLNEVLRMLNVFVRKLNP
jgi:four helix bundle protein